MTLRARLTGAFLVVVMGPVLVGSIIVGVTVTAENHFRDHDRLHLAVGNVRTTITASCDRLQSTAQEAAAWPVGGSALGSRASLAQSLVDAGRASAIYIDDAEATPLVTTDAAPASPWILCSPLPPGTMRGGPATFGPATSGVSSFDSTVVGPYRALAAAVAIRDPAGQLIGYTYAAQALTAGYASGLASAGGVQVTLLSRKIELASTDERPDASRIAGFAATLGPDRIGTDQGRYVQRIDPGPAQPFTVAVSIPATAPGGLFALLTAVVAFAAIAALGGALFLARTTTKPLDEIAEAADRIIDGDLDARAPVRHDDEVGHLGAAFNRLSRDVQAYTTALMNSRDQLRDNLDIIGDTLASTHDLPKILHVILSSAMSAGGAEAGVVLLVDQVDGRLRMECAEGFDGPTTSMLRELDLAPGEGILGSVATTGVARRGRVPDDGHTTGPVPAQREPTCRSYLAVAMRSPVASPALAAKSDGVGVLALYDRLGNDEFDDSDLRTVRSFASHATVAVDNVRAHAEAKRLSHTDPLTGLYNYRHLKDLLRRELNRAARFGHPLCVMVMDLDRFKEVNDAHGHAAGDAVLVEFSRRIGAEIRGVDLAFRYGGEEFVLLLPETDGLGGVALAQRLGAAVRDRTFTIPGGRDEAGVRSATDVNTEIPVSVSIGVAVYPEHGASAGRVLEAADDALYMAKAAGRDTFRLSPARRNAPPVVVSQASPADAADASTGGSGSLGAPPAVDPVAVIGAGGGKTGSSGGLGRWRGPGSGRGSGRSAGGTSGGTQPPRQSRGR